MMQFCSRKTALRSLNNIMRHDRLLCDEIHNIRSFKADARDINLCINIVYGVMQNLLFINDLINHYSQRPLKKTINSDTLNKLRISIYSILFLTRIPDYASVSFCLNWLKGRDSYLKGYFHYIMSRISKDKNEILNDLSDSCDNTYIHSIPEWLHNKLLDNFPEGTVNDIINSYSKKPSVYIRTSLKNDISKLPLLEDTILEEFKRVTDEKSLPSILGEIGKTKGPFYIQSLSSGLVSHIYKPEKNQTILDLCCGKGGKLIHFLDINKALNVKAFAYSHYKRDIPILKENIDFWKMSDRINLISNKSSLKDKKFPFVYLDVPCSGTGIISKAPDIKYKLSDIYLRQITSIQKSLLSHAISLTMTEGYILYCTCSILKEENEDIADFFKDVVEKQKIESVVIPDRYIKDNILTVLPDSDMDGITAILLRKRP